MKLLSVRSEFEIEYTGFVLEKETDRDTYLPFHFKLYQNYPYPLNYKTDIQYALLKPVTVDVWIYDITGRKVYVLAEKTKQAGIQTVEFDTSLLKSSLNLYLLKAIPT